MLDKAKIEEFRTHLKLEGDGDLGWVTRDKELFKQVLAADPKAPICFHVRNFNEPNRLWRMFVTLNGLGKKRSDVSYLRGDIVEFFPELKSWIKANKDKKGILTVRNFTRGAGKIATLLKRNVFVIHQFGSGRQEVADFVEVGPFRPHGHRLAWLNRYQLSRKRRRHYGPLV